jgi:23S rRNA pseudouridine1911/1915/1917 synthase
MWPVFLAFFLCCTMIEILIDDPWFLVINKPIDLLTQAVAGVPSVQSMLIDQLRNGPSKPFVGIPHRLDRMTSGVMVVARNQRALRRLCDQFAARSVHKEYLAWVFGETPERGEWTDWIRKIPDVAKSELADPTVDGARIAELEFDTIDRRTLPTGQPACLVRVVLRTGRMHQIRLQFASRGHPVLGDIAYGGEIDFASQERKTREPMLALHASRLQFSHPKTAERIVAEAPRPPHYPWNLLLA